MQLDRTHVVIRMRTLSEIGDLALVMLRRYPSALLAGFFLGALPWILMDLAVLAWIPINELASGMEDAETNFELFRYWLWMITLTVAQTPVAGILTTFYLGQAVFEQRPTWWNVWREVRKQFWRCLWVLGIWRVGLLAVLFPLMRIGEPSSGFLDGFIPIMILIYVASIRSARPFAPEILLLEQCPILAKKSNVIHYRKRSKHLHSPIVGELNGRFISIAFMLCWLWASVLYTLVFFRGVASGQWNWNLVFHLVLFPLSLWIVAGMSVIVRMLCYLDARIRLEGWEVELSIRAEAIRQFGDNEVGSLANPITSKGTA
jgi:hypothetical protein